MSEVDVHCSQTPGPLIEPSLASVIIDTRDHAAGLLRLIITAANAEQRHDGVPHVSDERGEQLLAMPLASLHGKLHPEVPMPSHTPSRQLRRRMNVVMTSWNKLIGSARDTYRPELHYMRGPGPKWHAKHRGHGKTTL